MNQIVEQQHQISPPVSQRNPLAIYMARPLLKRYERYLLYGLGGLISASCLSTLYKNYREVRYINRKENDMEQNKKKKRLTQGFIDRAKNNL